MEDNGKVQAWLKGHSATGAMFVNPWTNVLKELINITGGILMKCIKTVLAWPSLDHTGLALYPIPPITQSSTSGLHTFRIVFDDLFLTTNNQFAIFSCTGFFIVLLKLSEWHLTLTLQFYGFLYTPTPISCNNLEGVINLKCIL